MEGIPVFWIAPTSLNSLGLQKMAEYRTFAASPSQGM
jgi:hypothetical protein